MRDSVVFLRSYYESISKMPRKYRLEAYEAFCSYALDGTVPEAMSDRVSSLFVLMTPTIDSAAKRYRAAVENGKKGGRPRKTEKAVSENPSETQSKPDGKPKRNLNVDADDDADEDADDDADEDEDADADVVVVDGDLSTADEFSTREDEFFEEDDDKGTETVLSYLDGTKFFISREELDRWRKAYPDLDVELELRKMQIWLDNHPKRQKSSGGRHFIVSWLNMEVGKLKSAKAPSAQNSSDHPNFDLDEFFEAATYKGEEEMLSGDR